MTTVDDGSGWRDARMGLAAVVEWLVWVAWSCGRCRGLAGRLRRLLCLESVKTILLLVDSTGRDESAYR